VIPRPLPQREKRRNTGFEFALFYAFAPASPPAGDAAGRQERMNYANPSVGRIKVLVVENELTS